MTVTERIAEQRQLQNQAAAELLSADSKELEKETETRKKANLAAFEAYIEGMRLIPLYGEILEGQKLPNYKIFTDTSDDGYKVSLVLSWEGKRKAPYMGEEIISPPELGTYSIRAGVDYKKKAFFVDGSRRKVSMRLTRVTSESLELGLARAFVDPRFDSAIRATRVVSGGIKPLIPSY